MIDFSPTPEQEQIQRLTAQIMERYVYPAEEHLSDPVDTTDGAFFPGVPDAVLRPIQAKVKELGLWAPHMPEDAGGMGIGVIGLALMNEIIGRSPLGPVSFGCQAPDAGNVLHDVIDRAIQAHGAMGISSETPLEMFYREARAARIYDGPDEVHRMVVARRLLKTYR